MQGETHREALLCNLHLFNWGLCVATANLTNGGDAEVVLHRLETQSFKGIKERALPFQNFIHSWVFVWVVACPPPF